MFRASGTGKCGNPDMPLSAKNRPIGPSGPAGQRAGFLASTDASAYTELAANLLSSGSSSVNWQGTPRRRGHVFQRKPV